MDNAARFIAIHMIQNHAPANPNRDDLGAPKTAYFGGKLRFRISSQCIKRSIRRSELFAELCGGIRSRRLLEELVELAAPQDASEEDKKKLRKAAAETLGELKVLPDKGAGKKAAASQTPDESDDESAKDVAAREGKMLIYTTIEALREMAGALAKSKDERKQIFEHALAHLTAVPDIALSGRMLETGEIPGTRVEAALQVAHAISTHEALPEIDYYVAADDIPGEDAGAGFLDEAGFGSACYYKYFCIDWKQLVANLRGAKQPEQLAAHTVASFLEAAALVHPSGKRTSYAHHNPPDAIVVERRAVPISYANAFAHPVEATERGLVAQSCAQLAAYVAAIDGAYGPPAWRACMVPFAQVRQAMEPEHFTATSPKSLPELIEALVHELGFDWQEVRQVKLDQENQLCTLLTKRS
jgi:CRISPR system Cascade subunit CasC